MQALYRKYRPTRLDDVIGQESVTTALSNALSQGKIGHAYLFVGPRGTGKTSVARIFAHAANNFDYQIEDSYLDIIEIDAASNTGVDNIRDLREKAVIAPATGKYKVYIIDEVHMLSRSAANALLKTLEEPPAHVIFILATTELHKVPITTSSRTQVFTFHLAAPDVMTKHLAKIAKIEKIPIDDAALELIARRGGGSFRDSLSLLDQAATLGDQKITGARLASAFGLPPSESVNSLLEGYRKGDLATMHNVLRELLDTGLSAETIASELLERLVASPDPTYIPLLAELPKVQAPFPEAKLLLALMNTEAIKTAVIPQAVPAPATPPTSPAKVAPASVSEPTPEAPKAPNVSTEKPAKSVKAKVPVSPESSELQESSVPPESPASPSSEAPTPPKAADATPFNWPSFLDEVKSASEKIYLQLKKCSHNLEDGVLHLYPEQVFTEKILRRADSTAFLAEHLKSVAFVLHSVSDRPKDDSLSELSDIMGGEVREITADPPF